MAGMLLTDSRTLVSPIRAMSPHRDYAPFDTTEASALGTLAVSG